MRPTNSNTRMAVVVWLRIRDVRVLKLALVDASLSLVLLQSPLLLANLPD
jgi:hypothetical protein